jgi:N-acyl-D-amino-acid deacylase
MRRAALVLTIAATSVAAFAQEHDLVLRNGRVVDGTGSPWYRADIAIRGDTIVAIAPRIEAPARRVIDLGDQVVSPGFVDLHTHAIRGIFEVPTADNYIRQGVTTILEGADGFSPVPLDPFLQKLEATPRSINIGSFVGHGSVRVKAMGYVDRAATGDEIGRMRELVDEGMRDGAFGMSTGLFYTPATWATLPEVVALAKVAAKHGGMHNSHMRNEAAKVLESVAETIAVGEQGGLPTHVSHHKVAGRPNWGRSDRTLAAIDAARARGVDVTLDVYPYVASSTSLDGGLVPAWVREGGRPKMRERLQDPSLREKIRGEIAANLRDDRGGGDPRNVKLASCAFDASIAGKDIAQLTRERGAEVTLESAAETVMDLNARGMCRAIFFTMDEADVARIVAHPAAMIASDGEVPILDRGSPHPRSYGTFARVLAVYVREKKAITLEDAVRKMTSYPAQRIGIADRGVLRPGMKADIAVFDPATVRDLATYDQPHQYAEGFSLVLVNGQPVYEGGRMTAARPGRVLYGPARERPAAAR